MAFGSATGTLIGVNIALNSHVFIIFTIFDCFSSRFLFFLLNLCLLSRQIIVIFWNFNSLGQSDIRWSFGRFVS